MNHYSFCSKTKSVQYNATLSITGAIWETSQTKVYNKLRLESLRINQNDGLDIFVHYIKLKQQVCNHIWIICYQSTISLSTQISEDLATYQVLTKVRNELKQSKTT